MSRLVKTINWRKVIGFLCVVILGLLSVMLTVSTMLWVLFGVAWWAAEPGSIRELAVIILHYAGTVVFLGALYTGAHQFITGD